MDGHKLAAVCDEHDENALYWTDGKAVFYRWHDAMKGVDIDTSGQLGKR